MSAQVQCTHCGNLVPAHLQFCPSCGKPIEVAAAAPQPAPQPAPPQQPAYMSTPLPANEQLIRTPEPQQMPVPAANVFCPNCGQPYGGELAFCPSCGTPRGQVGAPIQVRTDTPLESKATNAMVAEIIGGLVGFMGIGHMIGGNVALGVILMVCWWVGIGILATMSVVLPICVVITCPAYIGIPVASGFWARNNVRGNVAMLR